MSLLDRACNMLEEDRDILLDEYHTFIQSLKAENITNPYYVYALTLPNGQPFYIGKGSGKRAWDHLFDYVRNQSLTPRNLKHNVIHELITELHEFPIVHIIENNLSENEALSLESFYVLEYGRLNDGSGILTNIMPGGKYVGSLPWWTNGTTNKKSNECTGEGYFRGLTHKRKGSK